MDIGDRLIRLMKANIEDKLGSISQIIDFGSGFLDEKLSEWEKAQGIGDDASRSYRESKNSSSDGEEVKAQRDQFTEDLGLFGLTPPSSLDEVKQARNREIKKFHPDKWVNEPEKQEVAQQIMQIYNAAYDRLRHRF